MAKDTLQVTMQHGVWTGVHPLMRRLRIDHLNLHHLQLRGTWFLDTLFLKVKSLASYTCANVYTQGKFTQVMPMPNKTGPEVAKSLIEFTNNVGIPDKLITNGATEFTGRHTNFVKQCRCMHIRTRWTESGRKNQNYAAEGEIDIRSRCWKK